MNLFASIRRLRQSRGNRPQAQLDLAALIRAYQETFRPEAGQLVLADILRKASVVQTTYVVGDAMETAFNEGRRRGALEIVNMINADPAEALRLATTGEIGGLFDEHRAA